MQHVSAKILDPVLSTSESCMCVQLCGNVLTNSVSVFAEYKYYICKVCQRAVISFIRILVFEKK